MKRLTVQFLIVYILFLMVGCSPQRRINSIVKRHPELAKQETKTIHGVLTVPKLDIKANFKINHDSARYIDLLGRYVKAANELNEVKHPGNTPVWTVTALTNGGVGVGSEVIIAKQKEINRLQKEIAKSFIPDTTYTINQIQSFLFEDSTINISTEIIINLNAEGITTDYHRSPIKIPYKKIETTTKIDARVGKPFFKDWWFWLFLLMLAFTFRLTIAQFTSNQYNRIKTKLPWN